MLTSTVTTVASIPFTAAQKVFTSIDLYFNNVSTRSFKAVISRLRAIIRPSGLTIKLSGTVLIPKVLTRGLFQAFSSQILFHVMESRLSTSLQEVLLTSILILKTVSLLPNCRFND